MHALKNEWLLANNKKISAIQTQLIEKSYQGAPEGDLDLTAVYNILGGAVKEITVLQEKVDELNEKLKKANEPKKAEG